MAEEGFSWIFLIFFLVPLVRIIPRLVRKWQKRDSIVTENQFNPRNSRVEKRRESFERPQDKEMQVLGELNKEVKDFNKIQRNLSIDNRELENILKCFEEQGLMNVVKRKGFFGVKTELYPTEKGYKRYYS